MQRRTRLPHSASVPFSSPLTGMSCVLRGSNLRFAARFFAAGKHRPALPVPAAFPVVTALAAAACLGNPAWRPGDPRCPVHGLLFLLHHHHHLLVLFGPFYLLWAPRLRPWRRWPATRGNVRKRDNKAGTFGFNHMLLLDPAGKDAGLVLGRVLGWCWGSGTLERLLSGLEELAYIGTSWRKMNGTPGVVGLHEETSDFTSLRPLYTKWTF